MLRDGFDELQVKQSNRYFMGNDYAFGNAKLKPHEIPLNIHWNSYNERN